VDECYNPFFSAGDSSRGVRPSGGGGGDDDVNGWWHRWLEKRRLFSLCLLASYGVEEDDRLIS